MAETRFERTMVVVGVLATILGTYIMWKQLEVARQQTVPTPGQSISTVGRPTDTLTDQTGAKFVITIMADDSSKPYLENFRQSLKDALTIAGLESSDGTKVDVNISDVRGELVFGASKPYLGFASVTLKFRPSRSFPQPSYAQTCTAGGIDENDAALKAMTATISKVISVLKDYAKGRTPQSTECFI